MKSTTCSVVLFICRKKSADLKIPLYYLIRCAGGAGGTRCARRTGGACCAGGTGCARCARRTRYTRKGVDIYRSACGATATVTAVAPASVKSAAAVAGEKNRKWFNHLLPHLRFCF